MKRYFRFSGIACVTCMILSILALLLLASSAQAQLTANGIGALRLGMTRVEIDSVIKADDWGRATIAYDPGAPTVDLLPDPSAPKAHPQIACDSQSAPPRCIFVDRVIVSIVPTRSGNSTTDAITVRTRVYGSAADRVGGDLLLLYRVLSAQFCPGAPCVASPAPKLARIRSFLAATRGPDTLAVTTWGLPNGAKESLMAAKLLLVRDRGAKLVWYEIVYEDLRKR